MVLILVLLLVLPGTEEEEEKEDERERRECRRLLFGALFRLDAGGHRFNLKPMPALPPSCPPLPEFPPLFWNRVQEQIAHWQEVLAQPQQPGDYTTDQMRKMCIARIKTRLKRIDEQRNAGRALFELADYLACLMVIESRN